MTSNRLQAAVRLGMSSLTNGIIFGLDASGSDKIRPGFHLRGRRWEPPLVQAQRMVTVAVWSG